MENRSLRIGFVSIWFERGQAYVTKMLRDVISTRHQTYVFARTGGVYGEAKLETEGMWKVPNLTIHPSYDISPKRLNNWIYENDLDIIIFNEEYDWELVEAAKSTGATITTYLDYFKEDWRPKMHHYDAVLCSTQRSYRLVQFSCPAHYIGWAVDTELFTPRSSGNAPYTFFHNAGWLGINYRKMTPAAIAAFDALSKHLSDITLFVHAQASLDKLPPRIIRIIENNDRITYHIETVPAPGLYHMGNVLLFPSKLEGLGLPQFEALSCGLPIIAVNAPPMNEIIDHGHTGLLVNVARRKTRQDNISFHENILDLKDFVMKMARLAKDRKLTQDMSKKARQVALSVYNMDSFGDRVCTILETCHAEKSGKVSKARDLYSPQKPPNTEVQCAE